MKNLAIILVWFTTIYVFVFAGLTTQTNIQIPIAFGLYIFGVFLVLFMVYTVLTDNYKTSKTFKDWYGDCPQKTLEEDEN